MKNLTLSLKIAAVFIGTVVGAGLASGQEIVQFFSIYGFKGMLGIVLCGILYIITGAITVKMSYKYNAASYRDLIYISCGKYLGAAVDTLTTFFLFGGTCIILAGSGSIFFESLHVPHIVGVLIMAAATAAVVFYSTDGLMFINSIIVPSMIIIILAISFLVFSGSSFQSYSLFHDILNAPAIRQNWVFSSLLYMSFNMLFATGVLAPMTRDIKNPQPFFAGILLGSAGLFMLTLLINGVLLLNAPKVYRFSIPMLYVAGTVGKAAGAALSVVIWMEMFSTEVSNVYSLAKKMCHNLKLDYKLSIVIVLVLAFPFTKIGFENLIHLLYPASGAVSMLYIICLIRLFYKSKKSA